MHLANILTRFENGTVGCQIARFCDAGGKRTDRIGVRASGARERADLRAHSLPVGRVGIGGVRLGSDTYRATSWCGLWRQTSTT
jgi:hypothetical protein